ncbi:hypothetical protein PVAG01_03015 [Phlyctema vagabunda]|uniref:Ubiquinol-cytochrome-c reductase complex assembly factor 2 n=1 Tax=Phlyctema vagabunda TaxID=108571 RepID=A0ABR4PS81_9HELO
MSKSIAYKHYLRALSRWPADPLRPECQFQEAMRRRIDRRLLPGSTGVSVVDEKVELAQANVLYSLLENRYSKQYPVSDSLMKPKSNPTHYTDLIKELEAVPDRSWWGNMVNKWKGFLRFQ